LGQETELAEDLGLKDIYALLQVCDFSGQSTMHGGLHPLHTVLPREGTSIVSDRLGVKVTLKISREDGELTQERGQV
jgi:hypothetical protein